MVKPQNPKAHNPEPLAAGKLLAVALLDCTIKVFFADSLKFWLSLYGHKLPVLSMDISSDSTLLASGSADKNLKVRPRSSATLPGNQCDMAPRHASRSCHKINLKRGTALPSLPSLGAPGLLSRV